MEYLVFGFIYVYIGFMYLMHNRHMGGWYSGTFVASLWWIVAGLWCWGFYLVWKEEYDMKRILEKQ